MFAYHEETTIAHLFAISIERIHFISSSVERLFRAQFGSARYGENCLQGSVCVISIDCSVSVREDYKQYQANCQTHEYGPGCNCF